MSSLEDLLTRLTIDIAQTQEHYVYYDKETNRIHKISPIKQESTFEFFNIASEVVEPILKGSCKLDDYTVYFDYKLKKFSIKRKQNESFSNISLIEITEDEIADITILLDNTYITILLHDSLHEHIANDQNTLLFVVTEKHNPYNLYYNFNIKASDVLKNNKHKHQLTAEQIKNNVSIYTNPVFETYSLKVNYDTEISSN